MWKVSLSFGSSDGWATSWFSLSNIRHQTTNPSFQREWFLFLILLLMFSSFRNPQHWRSSSVFWPSSLSSSPFLLKLDAVCGSSYCCRKRLRLFRARKGFWGDSQETVRGSKSVSPYSWWRHHDYYNCLTNHFLRLSQCCWPSLFAFSWNLKQWLDKSPCCHWSFKRWMCRVSESSACWLHCETNFTIWVFLNLPKD